MRRTVAMDELQPPRATAPLLNVQLEAANETGQHVVEPRADERGDKAETAIHQRKEDDRPHADDRFHPAHLRRVSRKSARQRHQRDRGADDEPEEQVESPRNLGAGQWANPFDHHRSVSFSGWWMWRAAVARRIAEVVYRRTVKTIFAAARPSSVRNERPSGSANSCQFCV